MRIIYSYIKNIDKNLKKHAVMAAKSSIERVKLNANQAKQVIQELKNELNTLNSDYNSILTAQFIQENAKLLTAVEDARRQLVKLETRNGIKQIPLPTPIQSQSVQNFVTDVRDFGVLKVVSESTVKQVKEAETKKEKKVKQPTQPTAELSVDVGRLDLRIAKIEDVQRHPDADSLYVLKINCGEANPRTVCSGLVKYIPIEELRDRYVVLLCNLKPVKMRGITSEAMVMCASSSETIEVLIPPKDCNPGEYVICGGYSRQPDPVMNPKKKIFESIAPDLHTNTNLQACYKNSPFEVPGKGHIVTKSLKNVAVK